MKRWRGATDDPRIELLLDSVTGSIAYDIGANIGMTSSRLALNFEHVVAFEPCRESFEFLEEEAATNVLPLSFAVSDKDGDLTLHEARRSIQSGQLVSKPGLHWGNLDASRDVPAITLDTAVEEYGYPDFVKVDTEGHEVEVIRGGLEFLGEFHPRLCIEIHHEPAEQEIRQMLPSYNLTNVRQSQYREESIVYRNHFWMVSTALL